MKLITIILLLSLTTISFSQITYRYLGSSNIETELVFKFDSIYYEGIKKSELFTKWEKETFTSNDSDKEVDKVILYLNYHILKSIIYIKLMLINPNSLDFIQGSRGDIFINEKGEINISYNFRAECTYGTTITSHCIYSISLDNGVENSDCYIYRDPEIFTTL